MKVLGIYGAGGLGREILELARIINEEKHIWDGFIFIDDGNVSDEANGVKIYKYLEAKDKYSVRLQIAMGVGEPAIRKKLFQKIKDDGVETPTLVHPDVYIPETTKIGSGTVIQGGCFISCNIEMKDYVLIQSHVNIGHDCIIGENSTLSSGTCISGAVHIGDGTYIAVGTLVKQGITIGSDSVVGMGSIVLKDIPENVIALGNPARAMKHKDDARVFA